MPYDLEYLDEAIQHLRALRAGDAAHITGHCRRILSVNPTLESRARIKRLRGGVVPPYRLRVDDYRVFYEVDEDAKRVIVWGVTRKGEADQWLAEKQKGVRDADEIA